MAPRLRALKQRAREAGIPTIYINDNFGNGDRISAASSITASTTRCRAGTSRRSCNPIPEDYFVLKPKQSAFYGTTLDTLLDATCDTSG